MTKTEAIKWLSNLKMDIGKTQHQELWHYEQAIDDIIEVLEQEPCDDCMWFRQGVQRTRRESDKEWEVRE